MSAIRFKQSWIWIAALVIAIAAPWAFYNYSTGRHSGFVLSMLSQMGMMSILALSYNMLLGQAGLFSLCHATFFGIGGYATIHFLNMAGAGDLPLPMEIIPVLSGLAGLGLAIVFGYMATKQRATAFAMITLGIGELMVTAALMFHHFFGGEGGVNANRMIGHSLFGLKYASGIQVYYLILVWTLGGTGDVLPDADAARPDGERHPRQFRTRPVHGLRPAHGALSAVRAVGVLCGDRRRLVRHYL